MKFNFDDYLNVVRLNIKNKKLHDPICEELEGHLQEAANFYLEIGYDEHMSKYKALEDMGPPHYVAEDLAKLHELSFEQKLTEVLFVIFSCVKIIDAVAYSLLGVSGLPNFLYAEEFAVMSAIVVMGFILSLSHKRVLPARVAVVYAAANFVSTIKASEMLLYGVSGKWKDYLTAEMLGLSFEEQNIVIVLASIVLAVAITGASIFTYYRIKTYVQNPNISSLGLKSKVYAISIPLLCIVLAATVGAKVHLYQADAQEKAEWNKVVEEFADFCLENEKITENDINKIVEHFDYLDFKDYSDKSDNKLHLSANIGDTSIACPHFYISVKEDDTVEIGVVSFYSTNLRSINPFVFARATDYDTVWTQFDSGYSNDKNPMNRLDQGDPAEKFSDIVKDENLMFIYKYYVESDEVYYITYMLFDDSAADIFFGGFTCKVSVESGVIETVYTDY